MVRIWNRLPTLVKFAVLSTAVLAAFSLTYGLEVAFFGKPAPDHTDQRVSSYKVWIPEGAAIEHEQEFAVGTSLSTHTFKTLQEFQALQLPKITVVSNLTDSTLTYWARNPDKEAVTDLFRVQVPVYDLPTGGHESLRSHQLDTVSQTIQVVVDHEVIPSNWRLITALIMAFAVFFLAVRLWNKLDEKHRTCEPSIRGATASGA